MRRLSLVLLLACLLLLPSTTPEVVAEPEGLQPDGLPEPTIPAPHYEVPLPLVIQLKPNPKLVVKYILNDSYLCGDIHNTGDQTVELYLFQLRGIPPTVPVLYSIGPGGFPIPVLAPGDKTPFCIEGRCAWPLADSVYAFPSDKQPVELTISDSHIIYGPPRHRVTITNEHPFPVVDVTIVRDMYLSWCQFPITVQRLEQLDAGESFMFEQEYSYCGWDEIHWPTVYAVGLVAN